VESPLTKALEHILKIAGFPSGPVERWSVEALAFLLDARRSWTPSMAQRLSVPALYADALPVVRRTLIDGQPPAPLPDACAIAVQDLIVATPGAPDIAELVTRIARTPATP